MTSESHRTVYAIHDPDTEQSYYQLGRFCPGGGYRKTRIGWETVAGFPLVETPNPGWWTAPGPIGSLVGGRPAETTPSGDWKLRNPEHACDRFPSTLTGQEYRDHPDFDDNYHDNEQPLLAAMYGPIYTTVVPKPLLLTTDRDRTADGVIVSLGNGTPPPTDHPGRWVPDVPQALAIWPQLHHLIPGVLLGLHEAAEDMVSVWLRGLQHDHPDRPNTMRRIESGIEISVWIDADTTGMVQNRFTVDITVDDRVWGCNLADAVDKWDRMLTQLRQLLDLKTQATVCPTCCGRGLLEPKPA